MSDIIPSEWWLTWLKGTKREEFDGNEEETGEAAP